MNLLALLLGLGLPTASGMMLARLIEGKVTILFRGERFVIGFVFGITGTMFLTFLLSVAGLAPISLTGLLTGQLVALSILGTLTWRKRALWMVPSPRAKKITLSRGFLALAIVLGTLTVMKLCAGTFLLTSGPAYFDDTLNNWNMRAKVYLERERIVTTMEAGNEEITRGGVLTYPPTVPMEKAFIASLRGEWSEGAANVPHMLWYLASVALIFFALLRARGGLPALLGAYIALSLPLFLIHGSSAYADAFLAMHIGAAVLMFFSGYTAPSLPERMAFLRMSAVAAGLLAFTKNESLLLHLPPFLLIAASGIWVLFRHGKLSRRDALVIGGWFLAVVAVVSLPWIAFKWANGLSFGNAKGIPAFVFPRTEAGSIDLAKLRSVAYAIYYNTFFEANWLLFFPLALSLITARFRSAFGSPTVILVAFVLAVIIGQLPIYFLTGLSTEVLRQTGYARGLVHLIPVAVTGVTILLWDLLREKGVIKE